MLRTERADALFAWRLFIDDTIDDAGNVGQEGVCCPIFRNESAYRSSDLIRQADACADCCWPGQRHYTFVDPTAVRSGRPGWCFIKAGWRECGLTKSGLVILERISA